MGGDLRISRNILLLMGVRKQDTAVFACNASNPAGFQFRTFALNVLSKC